MAAHTAVNVQQQASTYKHPIGYLFDGGSRRDYHDIVVPLYTASIEGDLEAAKVILKGREHLVAYSITERKDTPLHVAAAGHSTKLVKYLVSHMTSTDLELRNGDGNTAFCLAVISGNVNMVRIMAEKNRALLITCGSENKTPLYLATFHGNHEMVTFLYERTRGGGWTQDNIDEVLLKCIQADIFDVAVRILEDKEELPRDEHIWDMLQVLARKPGAFDRTQPIITAFLHKIYLLPRRGLKVRNATPLLRLLWKRIMEKPKDAIDRILRGPMLRFSNIETYPSQVLFIAAQKNNTQFLVELIREYPDLIWKRNDDGQTLFHIAVSHRHQNIFRLLYEIGSMKDFITPITDRYGNNILHMAGKNPERNAYDSSWVAAPFQMHYEFTWYKEVERILPPPCREVKNAAGQTPQEVFLENHKDLVLQGIKSINDTIHVSMVVSALVCTIGFSVIFSVPGGFDQKSGFPVLRTNVFFLLFILWDSLSFFLSAVSIIRFMYVIFPRPQQNTKVLMRGWVFGQAALMTSVSSIIGAFALTFLFLYGNVHKSTLTYGTYALAFVGILSYFLLHIPLYQQVYRVIYNHRYFFRPGKHMLYRKSPTFF